jgi:3-oxoacyl-[acyl-carrier-protein] synthase-1
MDRVFVTGFGFVTSVGTGYLEVRESLVEMRSGIALHPELQRDDSPVKVAGIIKGFNTSSIDPEDWTYPAEYKVRRSVLRSFSPHVMYAWCAMQDAIAVAGLEKDEISNPDTGIYTASGGSMSRIHKHFQKLEERGVMQSNPMAIIASIPGTLSFNLVSALKIKGVSCGQVSACASSGHSLGFATDEIRLGRQKRMFVVGAEDCDFHSIVPFCGMRALSLETDPAIASRPFDKSRKGFVSTGGAVVLVLENESEVQRRGVEPICEVMGWGQSSDGHDVAISHPEGDGLARAMKLALKDSQVPLEQIGYINAHATGTLIGDRSEIRAIRRVFGDLANQIPISSTKALTGHGLSLSSVMESGFCSIFLKDRFIPGSANIEEIDPEAEDLNIIQKTQPFDSGYILTNSSGFGGANVSVILKRCS